MDNYVTRVIREYPRLYKKIGDDYKNISLHTTKTGNYGLFYKNIFAGIFLVKEFIGEKEQQEIEIINDKFI